MPCNIGVPPTIEIIDDINDLYSITGADNGSSKNCLRDTETPPNGILACNKYSCIFDDPFNPGLQTCA